MKAPQIDGFINRYHREQYALDEKSKELLRKLYSLITFYNGGTISKYLNGEGKVGIVPCFDSPSDYFYGGFADKDVGEFINLPDEKYNDLIHKAQWEPLVEVRLKGKDM